MNASTQSWLDHTSVRLLLPPVLAAAAVAAHIAINVPPEGVVLSPHDQGVKKPKRPKPGSKKPARQVHKPRGRKRLAELRGQFMGTDFKGEPINEPWARKYQGILNSAAAVAREEAFAGSPDAPQVTLTKPECRKVRCRFLLRGPYHHEVLYLLSYIRGLTAHGEPLFHSFDAEVVEPPEDGSSLEDFYVQVYVAFTRDSVKSDRIRTAGSEEPEDEIPASIAAPPTKAAAPSPASPSADQPAVGAPPVSKTQTADDRKAAGARAGDERP